jgi:nitrogen fixation protein NifU and related proteins
MADDLNELYQEVILDHCRKPRNFRAPAGPFRAAEGRNPLCGDHFTVYLQMEGEVIRELCFEGSGCCISKASASMMTGRLKGQTAEQARAIFSQYHLLVTTGQGDEEAMGKLRAFASVHHFPMRVKCAILPWHAMLAGLKGEGNVTTEEKS